MFFFLFYFPDLHQRRTMNELLCPLSSGLLKRPLWLCVSSTMKCPSTSDQAEICRGSFWQSYWNTVAEQLKYYIKFLAFFAPIFAVITPGTIKNIFSSYQSLLMSDHLGYSSIKVDVFWTFSGTVWFAFLREREAQHKWGCWSWGTKIIFCLMLLWHDWSPLQYEDVILGY